jgi:cardiolipin synthase (CMP-forming)
MNIANNLSLFRVLLVPVFVACLVYFTPEHSFFYPLAIGIFLLACITDAADGYIARKLNQQTEFGSYIDPIADKLLLLSGFICLTFMTHLPDGMRMPAWVTIAVISRDAIILIGAVILFITNGKLKAEPLYVSKVTTVFQMGSLFVTLLQLPDMIQLTFFIATFTLTVISGVKYIQMGGRLLQTS